MSILENWSAYAQPGPMGADSVGEIVDLWLEAMRGERRPRTPGQYYISEIPKCYRQVWFSWFNQPEFPVETLRSFHLGNIIQDNVVWPALQWFQEHHQKPSDMLIDEYKKKGWTQREGWLSLSLEDQPSVQARGRWDFMFIHRDQDIMIELKTQKAKSEIKYSPNGEHIMQTMAYVHAEHRQHNGISYFNKIDLNYSPTFWFRYDENCMKLFFQRLRHHHHCIFNKVMPEAEARYIQSRRWACRYCEHSEQCDGVETGQDQAIKAAMEMAEMKK